MCTPVNQAATNGVVHQRSYRRVILIDWVVFRKPAEARVRVEIRLPMKLGIGLGNWESVSWYPPALFQTDNVDACLGQTPGECCA